MIISKSSAGWVGRGLALSAGALLVVGLSACSGVWLTHKDGSGPKGPRIWLVLYADSQDDVAKTAAYKALKADDVLAAVKALEESVKDNPENYEDRRRLAILYEFCEEPDMAISTLKEGIEVAKGKKDTKAQQRLESMLKTVEQREKTPKKS